MHRAGNVIQDSSTIEVFQPSDPTWAQIARFELPKIALRSMEHGSHPGRFLNDFRKQFSGSPVVYSTILGYGPPGRIFGELLALFIFERLIFGSYYANVEKPFVHFPARPEDEPTDFMPGVKRLEELLPYVEDLAYKIERFFAKVNASFEDVGAWLAGVAEMHQQIRALMAVSPLFEIPTKVFEDTERIRYRPDDVILEFHSLLRFVKMFLYALREETLSRDAKWQMLEQVSAIVGLYAQALEQQWGDIVYQNRTTGVRQDMRPAAVALMRTACELLQNELTAWRTGAPLPDIPEDPEEPAAGLTMDYDLFREMVQYSVDADAFIASKALAAEIAVDRVQFAQGITVKSELNLTQIVRSLPDQIKPEGEESLQVIAPQDVDIFLRGNERRIRGLFTNLITNSFQFGKRVTVRLEYDPLRQVASVRLSDNGKGVHPDLLAYDPHSRRIVIFNLGQTRRRQDLGPTAGGTGVGTTESFWVAQMHGGTLILEETVRAPNPAQGTTFLTELPAEVRAVWRRQSVPDFLALVAQRFAPAMSAAVRDAFASVRGRQRRLLHNYGVILRDAGDALNRDRLEYVDALVISRSLLEWENADQVAIVLKEYLLPTELDRLDPRMFSTPSAAARRAVILLRLMARVGNMSAARRQALLDALESIERGTAGNNREQPGQFGIHSLLVAALGRNLSVREQLALAHSIEEQQRTYLATESLDQLYRETQRLSQRVRGVTLRPIPPVRLQRMLEAKVCELVAALQERLQTEEGETGQDPAWRERERAHLHAFIREALIHPVGERLGDFPLDWRALIVYLAEHGVMAQVLSEIPTGQVKEWLEEMDATLPLVAAFLDPDLHGREYEQAIDDPQTPVHTRLMLKTHLPQVAMLADVRLLREVRAFLTQRGVQPKAKGLDYVRPILKRVLQVVAPEESDGAHLDRAVERVLANTLTTQPADWEQWLTYLAKVQTGAVLTQVSLMSDEEILRLQAGINAGLALSRSVLDCGLFDHLLEHGSWWRSLLPPDRAARFDHLVAQMTQIHAQTSLPLMENALEFIADVVNLWLKRSDTTEASLSSPAVDSAFLLSSLRSVQDAPTFTRLPESIRAKIEQAVAHGQVADWPHRAKTM
ncbi:MAG: ATP-binding protein [Abditibacteriales bacterium]|nr:ATP-binding protein [Abditibacteriales bacterium]MDW8364458.1 ATP-binding protein [Abditibacteriales bacterium]